MNVYESMTGGEKLRKRDENTIKRLADQVAKFAPNRMSYKRQAEKSPLPHVVCVGVEEWAALKRIYREHDHPWPPSVHGMAIQPTSQPNGVTVRPIGYLNTTNEK